MRQHRLEDLSVYYWLESILPNFVSVVDGFPEGDMEPPTISVDVKESWGIPFELGGAEQTRRFWTIDVFAQNKSQRDDFADLIFDELEQNIPVYNYDEGFPPDTSPTQLGILKCFERKNTPVYVFKELVRELYWRRSITFLTEFETI